MRAWLGFLVLLAGCATGPPPLSEALMEWSLRTGYQIVVPDCREARRQARVIQASGPQDELEQLLAGTGLHFEVINPRTVAIVCP